MATDRERLVRLFRRATGRHPTTADLGTLEQGLDALARSLSCGTGRRGRSSSCRLKPVPGDLDQADLAAWMLVANAIFNLDETLVRD